MRNMINLHTVRDDTLLDIKDSKAYKTYFDFATGKATPKKATGVVIKDTFGVSVSKKKAPAKVDKGKGMDLLSNAALLEAAQQKEAFKKSKHDSHMLHASGSGDGVGSQPKGDSGDNDSNNDEINDDDDDVDSDADCNNESSDSEKTNSDKDENPNLNQNDDEEEETQDDEYVHTLDYYVPTDEETNEEYKEFNKEEYEELYKDVNVRFKDEEHEKEGKEDAEMKNAGRDDVSREKSYEKVEDDANVTLTATQKTKGLMQSSSISSDFASQFLNLDNASPTDNKVVSMMNVKVCHEESTAKTVPPAILPFTPVSHQSTPTPTPTTEPTTTSIPTLIDFSSLFGFEQSVLALENELSSLTEFELKNILLDKLQKSKSCRGAKEHRDFYDPLVKSYQLDKDLFESYGKAYFLKRDREDKDKDEEPPAGSDQWLKK
ncbi:hypothetical protein Tco_0884118 [Tanacetum coccineum]